MSDLTPAFDELLKGRGAPSTKRSFSVEEVEEFLKKAYSINSDITSLHTQLLSLRQAYLSTAAPRKTHLNTRKAAQPSGPQQHPTYLTDRDREEIDAQAKSMLRELNASIRILDHEEAQRKAAAKAAIRQKYGRGIGAALGSWAAGGGGVGGGKSAEHAAAEDGELQVEAHRESVLWFLRQRLQDAVATQQGMMEARLTREMEKSQSVLAKARGTHVPAGGMSSSFTEFGEGSAVAPPPQVPGGASGFSTGAHGALPEEGAARTGGYGDLTAEQLQMFEKDNQDMLKYYESTLDKVRTAEKSLVEISELQTMLVNNLTMQSAHIDQLVADSFNTTENVGGGNKQLKKATQRASPARYTFFAASGLCLFLIVWDLLI
ncbi:Snare-complex protein syntaxin-18 N-terminus-domain-containing protein [Pleurostoma richardsiae]|uniref:Snare-complex protein syntaxin-18 N-terminus-domain-containing protein n=1 Tax=Pleurostoma richardsiae TaxID=41990 RepID=A0AA38VV07_9PEZI|nr:Snare-complex protein syntaxin-18 N-terminus-domain-containing protein [Pleurostoma richardsiae]